MTATVEENFISKAHLNVKSRKCFTQHGNRMLKMHEINQNSEPKNRFSFDI